MDAMTCIRNCFGVIPDCRGKAHLLHPLDEILTVSLLADVSGAHSYRAYEMWATCHLGWLRGMGLELPNGVPSHDTFARVFRMVDPGLLDCCMRRFNDDYREKLAGEVVAIDGKALCGASSDERTRPYIVSAWADAQGIVLGQVRTMEKSNEITAIPELLKVVDVRGCVVTIDAIGCQKTIVRQIVRDKGGDYVVALKENQPTLYAEMKELFEKSRTQYPDRFRTHETVEKNHGRFERRTCVQTDFVEWFAELDEWYGLRSVIMVEEERIVGGVSSVERRFYISSLGIDPKEALRIVRAHWGIENKLHWTLDVVFREDACRARAEHAAENLAIMRHIAHQVLGRVKKAHHCGYVVAQRYVMWSDEELGKAVFGKVVD